MSLVINTNNIATIATNNLNANQVQLQRSLARLSSGSKIVAPHDDAGGLAVSTKLKAALNRNTRTQQNVSNAISFMQTQDGALKVATGILDRMSELKTMSIDPTKNAFDIANYNTEFKQLQAQLVNINDERFNGINLFDSNQDLSVSSTEDGVTGNVNMTRNGLFDEISSVNATQKIISTAVYAAQDNNLTFTTASGLTATASLLAASNGATIDGAIKAINDALSAADISTITASESVDGKIVISATEDISIGETGAAPTGLVTALDSTGTANGGVVKTQSYNTLADYKVGDVVTGATSGGTQVSYLINSTWTGTDLSFDVFAASVNATRLDNSLDPGVAVWTATQEAAQGAVVYNDSDGRYYLSRGAAGNYSDAQAAATAVSEKANWLELGNSIPSITGASAYDASEAYSMDDIISYDNNLYVASASIAAGAGTPINNAAGWVKVDVAVSGAKNLLDQDSDISEFITSDFVTFIQTAATARAQNGAELQRLHVSNEMLETNYQNLEAANSRLQDVDVAQESTRFARYNILVQSAAAMLAQANASQSIALQLLQ
jgi:flagellin